MMKNFSFFIFLFLVNVLQAQSDEWTWMHGDSFVDSEGKYGTKGVWSDTSCPPAKYHPSYWQDKNGNFWLFGGSNKTLGIAADMWKYNPTTNRWVWISGVSTGNSIGVYGTKGIPSINNYPAARGYGAACWRDTSGLFWLFGGNNGVKQLNDLWRFDPNTLEWTWISGDNPNLSAVTSPNYGAKNVIANSNFPGSREECKSNWVDNNRLLFFGGSKTAGFLNDLWSYNIDVNKWVWIGGESTTNSLGNYGTLGISNVNNRPPARWSYTKWKSKNKIFIFGGTGPYGRFNDLWSYDLNTNLFTWEGGSNTINNGGIEPIQNCHSQSNSFPNSRFENHTIQTSECNKACWMFGSDIFQADLWIYSIDSNKWNRVNGDTSIKYSKNSNFKMVSNISNNPGGRFGTAIWNDNENNIYVFGGSFNTNFTMNDLWKYSPNLECFNINLTGKSIILPKNKLICSSLDTIKAVIVDSNIYNVKISPDSLWSFNIDSTKILFFPKVSTSYKISYAGGECYPTDTLDLNIKVSRIYNDTFIFKLCKLDTLYFDNQKYTTSGFHFFHYLNKFGCDSLRYLDVEFLDKIVVTFYDTFCHKDTYRYQSKFYTNSIIDTFYYKSIKGCDSLFVLNLTKLKNDTTVQNFNICIYDSLIYFDSVFKNSGIYYYKHSNKRGCDSIMKIIVFKTNYFTTNVYKTLCLHDSFLGYKTTGKFYDTFHRVGLCDSIRILHLTVLDTIKTIVNLSKCPNQTLKYFKDTFANFGIYQNKYSSYLGCDSFVVIHVNPRSPYFTSLNYEICSHDSFHGYSQTGIYTDTIASVFGCDSIIKLNLNVLPKPYNEDLTFKGCKGVIYKNMIFSESTILNETILNHLNCDSIYKKINIVIQDIIPKKDSILNSFCDSVWYQNKWRYSSFQYNDTIKTKDIFLCDSIVKYNLYQYYEKPIAKITIIPFYDYYFIGDEVTLKSNQMRHYLWSTMDTTRTIKVKLDSDRYYQLINWNYKICRDTSNIFIKVKPKSILDIPNAFSPTGMAENRVFKPNVYGEIESIKFDIFNRLGEKVYSTNTLDNIGWDGYYLGKLSHVGIYTYILEFKANRINYMKTGEFTLFR